MRTTLTIDDDVLAAVRQIADARGESMGHALSNLARSALVTHLSRSERNGVRLLPVGENARGATLDDVNRLRDQLG